MGWLCNEFSILNNIPCVYEPGYDEKLLSHEMQVDFSASARMPYCMCLITVKRVRSASAWKTRWIRSASALSTAAPALQRLMQKRSRITEYPGAGSFPSTVYCGSHKPSGRVPRCRCWCVNKTAKTEVIYFRSRFLRERVRSIRPLLRFHRPSGRFRLIYLAGIGEPPAHAGSPFSSSRLMTTSFRRIVFILYRCTNSRICCPLRTRLFRVTFPFSLLPGILMVERSGCCRAGIRSPGSLRSTR